MISGAGLAPDTFGSVGVCDPARTTLTGPPPKRLANVVVRFGDTAAPVACVINVHSGVQSVVVQAPFQLGAPAALTVDVKVGAAVTVNPLDQPTAEIVLTEAYPLVVTAE